MWTDDACKLLLHCAPPLNDQQWRSTDCAYQCSVVSAETGRAVVVEVLGRYQTHQPWLVSSYHLQATNISLMMFKETRNTSLSHAESRWCRHTTCVGCVHTPNQVNTEHFVPDLWVI